MTVAELKTHISDTLMSRPDLTGKVATALKFAHRAIQRDLLYDEKGIEYPMEWPCMEYRVPIASKVTWPAGATALALSNFVSANAENANVVKRLTDVWLVSTVAGSDSESPLMAATQDEIQRYEGFESHEFRNASIPSGVYHRRWYVDENTLKILFPPASTAADMFFTTRCYQILGLPADADSNWFTENIPDVLANWAAYYAWVWVQEEQSAVTFKQLAESEAIRTYKSMKLASKGGGARQFRPPTAQGRRF